MNLYLTCDGTKFYDITHNKTTVDIIYGALGSKGKKDSKSFASDELAFDFFCKKLKEKFGKGYVEKTSSGLYPPPSYPKFDDLIPFKIVPNVAPKGVHSTPKYAFSTQELLYKPLLTVLEGKITNTQTLKILAKYFDFFSLEDDNVANINDTGLDDTIDDHLPQKYAHLTSFYLRYNGNRISTSDSALFQYSLKKTFKSEYKDMVLDMLGTKNTDFDFLIMYLSDKLEARGDDNIDLAAKANDWFYFEFE